VFYLELYFETAEQSLRTLEKKASHLKLQVISLRVWTLIIIKNVTQHHSTSVAQFLSIRLGDCFGSV